MRIGPACGSESDWLSGKAGFPTVGWAPPTIFLGKWWAVPTLLAIDTKIVGQRRTRPPISPTILVLTVYYEDCARQFVQFPLCPTGKSQSNARDISLVA